MSIYQLGFSTVIQSTCASRVPFVYDATVVLGQDDPFHCGSFSSGQALNGTSCCKTVCFSVGGIVVVLHAGLVVELHVQTGVVKLSTYALTVTLDPDVMRWKRKVWNCVRLMVPYLW